MSVDTCVYTRYTKSRSRRNQLSSKNITEISPGEEEVLRMQIGFEERRSMKGQWRHVSSLHPSFSPFSLLFLLVHLPSFSRSVPCLPSSMYIHLYVLALYTCLYAVFTSIYLSRSTYTSRTRIDPSLYLYIYI